MKSYQQLSNSDDFDSKPTIVIRSKKSEEPYAPTFVPEMTSKRIEFIEQGAEYYLESLSTDV